MTRPHPTVRVRITAKQFFLMTQSSDIIPAIDVAISSSDLAALARALARAAALPWERGFWPERNYATHHEINAFIALAFRAIPALLAENDRLRQRPHTVEKETSQ